MDSTKPERKWNLPFRLVFLPLGLGLFTQK